MSILFRLVSKDNRPSYPWEHIAADLFELKGTNYLLVADYFSRFVEVQKLAITTSSNIVTNLKAMFTRFGIPATLVTDNRPHFDSEDMKEFAQTYEFHHISSSPYDPQIIFDTISKYLKRGDVTYGH